MILKTKFVILTKNETNSKTKENNPSNKVEVVFLISLFEAN